MRLVADEITASLVELGLGVSVSRKGRDLGIASRGQTSRLVLRVEDVLDQQRQEYLARGMDRHRVDRSKGSN
jgi:hypothetical protein